MSKGNNQGKGSARPSNIAICGIGCIFPQADDLEAYWDNIKKGVDSITDTPRDTHWNAEDYLDPDPKVPDMTYCARGGFLSPVEFNPMEYGIAPKDIEATDTTQIFGMIAAKEALKDAGYWDAKHFNRARTSVILGVTSTLELTIPLGARLGHPIWRKACQDAGLDEDATQEVVERIGDGYVPWQENSFPGLLGNVAAGRIANRLDLGGTNCVVDAACASSLSALHLAEMELTSGKADMVLTGGIDTFNDIFMYMCFSKTPALSASGNAKPFSKDGDGTILGEGLGILVLKRLEDAERDGDKIYAVIKGVGSSSDGKGEAIYAPSSKGQVKALRRAYEQAGIKPSTIELAEGHGTGTKVGDATEVNSMNEVFSEEGIEGSWCALGSVKSQIGHTKAAAGIAALIKATMAVHQRVLPPTIKVSEPLDVCGPDKSAFYLNTTARPWVKHPDHPRRAAISAFGFGGSNFHCVIEETPDAAPAGKVEIANQIIAFSGPDQGSILKKLDTVPETAKWNEVRAFAARSRSSFDAKAPYRLFLVCSKAPGSLGKALAAAKRNLSSKPGAEHWSTHEGAIFGRAEATGKLGFLFPGQGSQYVGMLRDLACQFPEFQGVFDSANDSFNERKASDLNDRLSDYIYPHPSFDKAAEQRQTEQLKQTQIAQPAIGATSLGGLNTLCAFGLKPDMVAGHSYGELVALHAAGRINEATFHEISNLRGRLMFAASQEKEAGGMLVAKTTLEAVQEVIGKDSKDLVIANHNAPDQVVLAGTQDAIQKASALFSDKDIWNRTLPVSAAFHSPLVAKAREPFLEKLKQAKIEAGHIPAFANSTADVYPDSDDEVREILSGQLAQSVRFVEQIEAMYEHGSRTFVEVGPGNVLSGLMKSILSDKEDVTIVSLDGSKGRKDGIRDLALTLCEIAASGHDINLQLWDEEFAKSPERQLTDKPKFGIAISGANQRSTTTKRPPSPPRQKVIEVQVPVAAEPTAAPAQPTMSAPTPPSNPAELNSALRTSQDGLMALQRLQEQTADLHRKFLEGQDAALQTFMSLIQNQGSNAGVQMPAAVQQPVAPPVPNLTPAPNPAPVSTAAAAPTESTTATPATTKVAEVLLEVVAEKTGYPTEMLTLDMGLDSDLGIDSIKRVEIMSALQSQLPDAPEIKPDQLGSLQTLQQVVDYLGVSAPATGPAAAPAGLASDKVSTVLLEVVAKKTGYPTEMLTLDMGLDSDLGIDSIKRVEIMSALQAKLPDAPEIKPDQLGSLQTLQQVVDFLDTNTTSAAPATTPTGPAADQVSTVLLEVVSEKTGYPTEMLTLDMGLDSDLGIDSIKRVEIMSALQGKLPDAPEITPEHLGQLNTLQEVVTFLSAAPSVSNAAPAAASTGPDANQVGDALLKIVAEKTGYPTEMLNLEMGLDSDLGIDSIKRVEIMSALQNEMTDIPEIRPDDLGSFQTLQHVVDFLTANAPASAPTQSVASPESLQTADQELDRLIVKAVPRTGPRERIALEQGSTIWLADENTDLARQTEQRLNNLGYQVHRASLNSLTKADLPARLGALIILSPTGQTEDATLASFTLIQKAGPALRRTNGSFLTTVSRLDGAFGLKGVNGNSNPVAGALAGMTKTAKHEWPEVHCKAIDVDAEWNNSAKAAEAIVTELFLQGPTEVGIAKDAQVELELHATPINGDTTCTPLQKGDVVVVSGGARGVTAITVTTLAKAFQPTLVILGRSQAPETEPAWLKDLTETSAIKRAIHSNLDGSASLKEVEARYRKWMGNREVSANLRAMEQAGAKVIYRSVDIRDRDAVGDLLASVRKDHGPIRGIIHGAGVLADRKIEDKTNDQFEQVYSTKVDGLRALLAGTADDGLKIVALFSSFTGRYGRTGQVDYAAANEVLNKLAQAESSARPDCRVVSVNWGPWNGGMVTDGLKAVFDKEGVGLIEPQAGADYLVRELSTAPGGPVEVVVVAPSPGLTDIKRGEENHQVTPSPSHPVSATGEPAFTTQVSVNRFPFLKSHVINGKAVVPAALMIEWMAHAALHGHPGMVFNGLNKFSVLKGIILAEDESLSISANVQAAKDNAVPVQIVSQQNGKSRVHARAEVQLGNHVLPPSQAKITESFAKDGRNRTQVYQTEYLFHGPELEGIEQVTESDKNGITATIAAAPKPAAWITEPLRQTWITEPLMLDCCFQLMILWSQKHQGAHSLPTGVGKLRQFVRRFPKDAMSIRIRVTKIEQQLVQTDLECLDSKGKLLAAIEGYECVLDPSLKTAFAKNQLAQLQQS
jgi:acyl transferase domain-containing protein/NAD(P)-dependent dehydrogenase (short-subunit alcohol dehydrogenase family)